MTAAGCDSRSVSELQRYSWGETSNPTIVLLHGLTDAGTTWPDAVRRWQGGYHLIAVDLRGHGRSPRFEPDQLTRCYQWWLSDTLDLLSTLDSAPVVVGHSLGGLFALRAAAARPELVRGLVLEDPARPPGAPTPDPEFVAMNEAFLDSFADGGQTQRDRMRAESRWAADEIDQWAASKPLVDRAMIHDGLTLGDGTWEPVFNGLTVPTLLVAPTDSPMAPDPALITNPLVQQVRLDGVGHTVRRDDAQAYHAVVDPFLAAVTAGSPAR